MIPEQDEGHSVLIIISKLFICLFCLVTLIVNWKANSDFSGVAVVIPGFLGVELTSLVTSFSFMSCCLSAYGSFLFYAEDHPQYRTHVRPSLHGYLVWDVALFLELLTSSGVLFYAHAMVDYMFQEGFYEALSRYKSDPEVASSIDFIQATFACCGNSNHSEWFQVQWNQTDHVQYIGFPESCCNVAASEAMNIACLSSVEYNAYKLLPYAVGCLDVLKWWYGVVSVLSACFFLAASLFHLLGLLLTFSMLVMMKNRRVYTDEEKKKLIFHQTAVFKAALQMGH